jgi:hypothetical protein
VNKIVRFPNCRPLTKLEYRESLRAYFNNPNAWRRSQRGALYIWIATAVGPRWVQVYQRAGGWAWGSGLKPQPFGTCPTWSQKTYDTAEIAKRKAWLVVLGRVEWDREEALGWHDDDGDHAA